MDAIPDVGAVKSPDALLDLLLDRYEDHPDASVLEERLRANVPNLWRPFTAVYGDDPEQIEWLVEAVDAAVTGFDERPEPLRTIDQNRTAEPDWFQGAEQVGYMCYVDLFNGDLDGVREKVPYLKELGVTYLHLMPLLEPRPGANDGGYAVKDYRSVDPRLGDMDDLRKLAADLHEEDIALVLDFVMNHTAKEHEWAQAAKDGDERFSDFYMTYEDRTMPDQYDETVPEVFPDFAPGNFTYVEEMDRWVWTSFYDFQWDLNYANPDVFVQQLREMLFLVNVGTDVLRLDAVPFLWKELGTDCRNLEPAHEILRAYRALMRIAAPGVLFKAEAIVSPDETVKYLGTGGYEGQECDIAYNAPLMAHLWHALAGQNTDLLEHAMTQLPETPEPASWINYVRCHDDIGWGLDDQDVRDVGHDPTGTRRFCADFYAGDTPDSFAEGYRFQVEESTGEARTSGTMAALTGLQQACVEGDDEDVDMALQRALLLHNVVFAAKGMPLLYSGDEIGQFNDFSYLKDPLKEDDNRWVHRVSMDWERAERRHEEGTVEQRLFDGLSDLIDARKAQSELHTRAEENVLDTDNGAVFALERVREDDALLSLSNFSASPQAVDISALPERWQVETFVELVEDEIVHYPDGRIILGSYEYLWLEPAGDETPSATVTTTIALDVDTEWGESVQIVGPSEYLGQWNMDDALDLSYADDATWQTDLDLPEGTVVEFEWVKVSDGEVVEWAPMRLATKAGSDDIWSVPRD